MVAGIRRSVGKRFDSSLILQSQPRSLRIYPRLELAAVGKMKSFEQRSLVKAGCRREVLGANCFLEIPEISLD